MNRDTLARLFRTEILPRWPEKDWAATLLKQLFRMQGQVLLRRLAGWSKKPSGIHTAPVLNFVVLKLCCANLFFRPLRPSEIT